MSDIFQSALINGLGFGAGTIILGSGLPQIIRNLQDPAASKGQSLTRNLLLTLGNAMWVGQGLLTENAAITCMCTLGTIFNFVISLQVWRFRRGKY